ncbi:MAG: Fe(2+) transporter permease subunit FeoB, partial [Verrucomicrobiota bacterium]|nr:Fe(2+) transporter permease subunit FeoB [Verrucomicrobiota bacterium]
MKKFTIALAGNPNSGKTTLFNDLTGSKQRIGNWPGVTVEHTAGEYLHEGSSFDLIDLPGIYSFTAYSLDEKVSREFILNEKPDLVINIVDATNLERNLYLTTQLLEMKVPVVVALNMMDMAKKQNIKIEVKHLAKHLDCPVVPIVASQKKGIPELKNLINKAVKEKHTSSAHIEYDELVEQSIKEIQPKAKTFAESAKVDPRWLTIKLFEEDELAKSITSDSLAYSISAESAKIEKYTGDETDLVIADGRYGFIHGLAKDVIARNSKLNKTITDSIDKIILNRVLGLPVFLFIMYMMFVITMNAGGPFIDFFDILCGTIFVDGLRTLLESWGLSEFLIALLADGLGGGIQTVATFIPPIGLIFLCISILEDSGYMARAAFVMDRLLRMIGLPGKAFIPMLVGLGCNVPGIMATRTLENNRDRLLSILINPFISCGARLPIYALFAAVFFRESAALMLFGLYFTGITMAVLSGLLFGKTILQGETSTFVMELPPYHIPTINGILFHTWNRLKSFILRAGKVILVTVVILSFLNSMGTDGSFGNQDGQKSVLSSISKSITPIFKPMGLTDKNWPATVGLFTGLFAKEAVVGTLNSLYGQIALNETKAAKSPNEPATPEPKFDFWGGIADAFKAIPAGYEGFF